MWRVQLLVLLGVTSVLSDTQLKLVHVVFSHKLYAPVTTNEKNESVIAEKLDYQYFLEETFDMDNKAKLDLFNLGVFIRKRYNNFLGPIYHPDYTTMRTTEYVLSMISGMLVNAGLWPPADAQKWNLELDWQPVPVEYQPVKRDTLLLGHLCPTFRDGKVHGNHSAIVGEHSPLLNYISKYHGKKVETLWEVAMLYSCLETIVSQNASLPAWARPLFPNEEMKNLTIAAYESLSQTVLQRRLNGGSLLKKILLDTVAHETSKNSSKMKLLMYSGEEISIMGLLHNLGAWQPHILDQGASIIFEVHEDSVTHEYAIKMFYLTDVNTYKLIPINLNNCKEYCPVVKFASIVDSLLPVDELSACNQQTNSSHGNHHQHHSAAMLSHMISLPAIIVPLLLSKTV